jgi:hypothetical protein
LALSPAASSALSGAAVCSVVGTSPAAGTASVATSS